VTGDLGLGTGDWGLGTGNVNFLFFLIPGYPDCCRGLAKADFSQLEVKTITGLGIYSQSHSKKHLGDNLTEKSDI
jgi:hypothetical protein